jgi:hypothetical protein
LSPELLAQIAELVRSYEPPAAVMMPPGDGTPTVVAAPGSELDQLSARYAALKPQLDALAKQVKDVTDRIKVNLMMTQTGADAVLLRGPSLVRPLKLGSYQRTTVAGKELQAAHPEIYDAFSKTTTVWTLQAVNG